MQLKNKKKRKTKSNAVTVRYGKRHLETVKHVEKWNSRGLDLGVE